MEEVESGGAPRVGDWFEANWFDDLVKIPLIVYGATTWYANLIVGEKDNEQTGGYCLFDNNSPRTVIVPAYRGSSWDDWYTPTAATCDDTKTSIVRTDGFVVKGYECRQRVCIGSWKSDMIEDVHTTVCNDNQSFVDSTSIPSTDWTYYLNRYGLTNSICGLGKEAATHRSQSFISMAVNNGNVKNNVYSFEIYPVLQYISSSNAFHNMKLLADGLEPDIHSTRHLEQSGYKYTMDMQLSYLTLGGYDKTDIDGEITWYDTSASPNDWNITATNLTIAETNVNPSQDVNVGPVINFQIGFPYIGLSKYSWEPFYQMLFNDWNPSLTNKVTCNSLKNNQFCYWRNTQCDQVSAPGNFTLQIGDYNYTLPVSSFIAQTLSSSGSTYDCNVFVTELDADEDVELNFIRLGDPFFQGFMPVFDIDND